MLGNKINELREETPSAHHLHYYPIIVLVSGSNQSHGLAHSDLIIPRTTC